MFSHALVTYIGELKQNAQKTVDALDLIVNHDRRHPLRTPYDFYILKDLKDNEKQKSTIDPIESQMNCKKSIEQKDISEANGRAEPALISLTVTYHTHHKIQKIDDIFDNF